VYTEKKKSKKEYMKETFTKISDPQKGKNILSNIGHIS